MSNVIKFPNRNDREKEETRTTIIRNNHSKLKTFVEVVLKVVWYVVVLTWPLLKWILALGVVWHGLRTIYYWDTPGVHAGWECLGWFGLLCALTYFIAFYEPKSA